MDKVFQRGLILGFICLASMGTQPSVLGAPIPFSPQKKPLSMEKIIQNYLTKNNVAVRHDSGLRRKIGIRKRKEAYGRSPLLSVKKPGAQFSRKIVKMKSPVPYKGLTVALEEKF